VTSTRRWLQRFDGSDGQIPASTASSSREIRRNRYAHRDDDDDDDRERVVSRLLVRLQMIDHVRSMSRYRVLTTRARIDNSTLRFRIDRSVKLHRCEVDVECTRDASRPGTLGDLRALFHTTIALHSRINRQHSNDTRTKNMIIALRFTLQHVNRRVNLTLPSSSDQADQTEVKRRCRL